MMSAYPESQEEQLELPSSDTLVADDDDEDWIKMLSSELNLDEDHKDILEDMSDVRTSLCCFCVDC